MSILWLKAREIRAENRPHAIANASYAAQLLEEDRRATRLHELRTLIEGYEGDIRQLQGVCAAMREECALLELRP